MYRDHLGTQNVFCRRCGSKLEVRKKLSYYDSETGKPKFELTGRCPRKNFLLPYSHDETILEIVD